MYYRAWGIRPRPRWKPHYPEKGPCGPRWCTQECKSDREKSPPFFHLCVYPAKEEFRKRKRRQRTLDTPFLYKWVRTANNTARKSRNGLIPPFAQLVFSPSTPLISFRDPASRDELGARPLRTWHSELS